MIFYAAGFFEDVEHLMRIKRKSLGALLSCYYLPETLKPKEQKIYDSIGERPLLLDSGAFSLKNVKDPKPYSIDDYLVLLRKYKPSLYVAFDVVGNPEQTLHNTMYMYEQGFEPLPVIQVIPGMDARKVCEPYIRAGIFKHIAIGNIVKMQIPSTECQAVWEVVRKHWPVKVHAFGNGSRKMLYRFPWHSFDSSSWLVPQRFRRMTIPTLNPTDPNTFHFENKERLSKVPRTKTVLGMIHHGIPRNLTTFTKEEHEALPLHRSRSLYQAYLMDEYAKKLTEFWSYKGVDWA